MAVSVQSMVFGNMGETSGSGMACTRNPETGDRELSGKFAIDIPRWNSAFKRRRDAFDR